MPDANWLPQGSGTRSNFWDVAFADQNNGFVVGDQSVRTTNGGITWSTFPLRVAGLALRGILFRNSRIGWAVGYTEATAPIGGTLVSGVILKTEDGGNNWSRQANLSGIRFQGLSFVDDRTGWVVGPGAVYRTLDGGQTWNPVGGNMPQLTDVSFADQQTGWVVGYRFWYPTGNPPAHYRALIMHTADGGGTWTPQYESDVRVGTPRSLLSVAFTDAQTGWAVGTEGMILHTVDGGGTWTPQTSGTSEDLTDVLFVNARRGFIVGRNGTILHTMDGGVTWTPEQSGTSNYLTAITFFDTETGWAVGHNGTILHREPALIPCPPTPPPPLPVLPHPLCVNVRDFGAKGDGSDATREIQLAIDTIASAGGGKVCVPPGLYMVSRAIDLKDHVHLQGSGLTVTTLKLKDNISMTLEAEKTSQFSVLRFMGVKYATVSDLRIDGNKACNRFLTPNYASQSGIAVLPQAPPWSGTHSEHCLIERCGVENCVTHGIGVVGSRFLVIRDCFTLNNGIVNPDKSTPYSPFGIVLVDGTEHCIVERCSAFGNPHGGIECAGPLSKYNQIRYCHADSIVINANSSKAAPVHNSVIGCVVDNKDVLNFRPIADSCIVLTGRASCVTVRDCHCIVTYAHGIVSGWGDPIYPQDYEKYPRNNIILNNRIEWVGSPRGSYAGINLGGCTDFIVQGNTIVGEFSEISLRLLQCRQGVVTGNALLGNLYWSGGTGSLIGQGIGLLGSVEITVTGNAIRGFEFGFAENTIRDQTGVASSDHNLILGNILKNNRNPIGGTRGSNSIYTANIT